MDEYFQSWVLHPDENTNAFWRSWLLSHPEKAAEIEEAKDILSNFSLPHYTLSQDHVSELWKKIQFTPAESAAKVSKPVLYIRLYWAAAAAVLMGFMVFIWITKSDKFEYRTQFGETKTIVCQTVQLSSSM